MGKEAKKVGSEAPAAEYVATDTLHGWPDNPDPPTPKDVRDVAKSIRRFGFGDPIVARRENGEIINGHCRWMAAKYLRLATVPCRFMDLDEDEAHLLAIADNRLAANRKRNWKSDDIADLLEKFDDAGMDLTEGTGFSQDEVDALLIDDFDALQVEEIDTANMAEARFSVHVSGPVPAQPEVLSALRDALAKIEGVTAEVSWE